jgi:hypothetical protein
MGNPFQSNPNFFNSWANNQFGGGAEPNGGRFVPIQSPFQRRMPNGEFVALVRGNFAIPNGHNFAMASQSMMMNQTAYRSTIDGLNFAMGTSSMTNQTTNRSSFNGPPMMGQGGSNVPSSYIPANPQQPPMVRELTL